VGINSYISKQFSSPEGFGGKVISLIMNRQNRPLYDETIRLLSLTDSDSVLDIGCGNGYVLNLLARKHNASFAGIDTSESAIKAADRRNQAFVKNKTMRLSFQNASSMSFSDGSFSKAYTINTVYFWNDLYMTMADISRVLKSSGVFINTLYSNETLAKFSHTKFGYKNYTTEQLKKVGADLGFAVKAEPILSSAAYCIIYQKNSEANTNGTA